MKILALGLYSGMTAAVSAWMGQERRFAGTVPAQAVGKTAEGSGGETEPTKREGAGFAVVPARGMVARGNGCAGPDGAVMVGG